MSYDRLMKRVPAVVIGASLALAAGPLYGQANGLDPLGLLEQIDADIAANRSSSEYVELEGTIRAWGRTIQGPRADAADRYGGPPPYEDEAVFHYRADEFGRRSRWEITWNGAKASSSRRWGVDGNVMLDASGRFGYLRPLNEAESAIFDFFRDHWPHTQGSVSDTINVVSDDPTLWSVTRDPDRQSLSLVFEQTLDGVHLKREFELRAEPPHLPLRFKNVADIEEVQWTWARDDSTGIWYPKRHVARSRLKWFNGVVHDQQVDVEITKARFDLPLDDEDLTFESLGLPAGASVFDMRVDPPVRYEFFPTAGAIEQGVKGLTAVEQSPANTGAPRVAASPKRTRMILITVNAVVVAALLGMYFARRRQAAPRE